jgi:putative transposase
VTRAGYYAWKLRKPNLRAERDAWLLERIRAQFDESHGTYGCPRIFMLLKRQGIRTSRKRVARLMRMNGLKARANLIYRRNPGARIYSYAIPNRCKGVTLQRKNQLWVGDVTYLRIGARWRYLAVVMDAYSRRVLAWRISKRRTLDLTLKPMHRAITTRKPAAGLMFHSDRGNEYAAYAYRDLLERHGIVQSMNRPGTIGDNTQMESFFHTLKSDMYHGMRYATTSDLESAVGDYIRRYNHRRIHSALDYRAPVDYERKAA